MKIILTPNLDGIDKLRRRGPAHAAVDNDLGWNAAASWRGATTTTHRQLRPCRLENYQLRPLPPPGIGRRTGLLSEHRLSPSSYIDDAGAPGDFKPARPPEQALIDKGQTTLI